MHFVKLQWVVKDEEFGKIESANGGSPYMTSGSKILKNNNPESYI